MTCSFGGGTTTTTSVRSTRSESTVFCHTNIVTMGTKDPYDTNDMAVKMPYHNECYCDDGALITSDATQRGYTQQTLITFGLL